MALVKKIFQRERKFGRSSPFSNSKSAQNYPSPEALVSEKSWNAPDFDANQIRALVFIENGPEGRRLIFDSKAIKKVKSDEKKCVLNRSNLSRCHIAPRAKSAPCLSESTNSQPQYQFGRRSGDVTMLEEMVYGSLPMSSKGTTVKVHVIRQPPELMLSKVFTVKNQRESQIEQENNGGDDVSLSSTVSDFSVAQTIKNNSRTEDSDSSVAHSLPMEMPTSPLKHYKSNYYDDDSGIVRSASTSSFHTPYPSPGTSVSSTTSDSWHRRYLRHQATSIDFRRRSTELSSTSSLTSEDASLSRHRKQKIGVSIIISLCSDKDDSRNKHFQTFFFSHFPLFEHHFYKLGIEVEKSIQQKNNCISAMFKALDSFRNGIRLLYTAPRIQEPVWLNMTTCYNQHGQLCDKFMKQLVLALDQYENKNTNFFVSRLVTAVLMNHLAWVPTVTPSGSAPSQLYLAKHSSDKLDVLAKTHPYNPLWAQLGDLYGALGVPIKTAKTVVVGKKSDVICRLLYILSYFIRCSEVQENLEKRQSISEDDMFGRDTPMFECPLDFEGSEFVMVDLLQSKDLQRRKEESCANKDCKESNSGDNLTVSTHGNGDVDFNDGDSGCQADVLSDARHSESVVMDTAEDSKCCQERTEDMKTGSEHSETASEDQDTEDAEKELPSNDDAAVEESQETVQGCTNLQNNNSKFQCKVSPVSCSEHRVEHLISVGKSSVAVDEVVTEGVTGFEKDVSDEDMSKRTSESELQGDASDVKVAPHIPLAARAYRRLGSTEGSCSLFDEYFTEEYQEEALEGISEKVATEETESRGNGVADNLNTEKAEKSGVQSEQSCVDDETARSNCDEHEKCETEDEKTTSGKFESDKERSQDSAVLSLPISEDNSVPSEPSTPTTSHAVVRPRTLDFYSCPPTLNRMISRTSSDFDPRELSRMLSNTSSDFDPFGNPEELPLPGTDQVLSSVENQTRFEANFGRSLLGGYSSHYLPDFALHGTKEINRNEVIDELKLTVQHSVLDEHIAEAVCIVGDTENWKVELLSSQSTKSAPTDKIKEVEVTVSTIVMDILHSVSKLWHLKMPPEFCVTHLEDRLQELFFKSRALAEYLNVNRNTSTKEISAILGINPSDVELLFKVTCIHSPWAANSLVNLR